MQNWQWQVILALFFVLLPMVLMVDFWNDERLTSRGRPIARAWPRRRAVDQLDDDATHAH